MKVGTPWADGTAAISQCAINPGETFNYRFIVDRVITFLSLSLTKKKTHASVIHLYISLILITVHVLIL